LVGGVGGVASLYHVPALLKSFATVATLGEVGGVPAKLYGVATRFTVKD